MTVHFAFSFLAVSSFSWVVVLLVLDLPPADYAVQLLVDVDGDQKLTEVQLGPRWQDDQEVW